jgi:hypothetical protein
MYGMYGLIARNGCGCAICEVENTSMKRKDNVVELAATHLHQSAIAETKIGKQPVAAVAEVARGAVKERQKKRKGNRILAGGVAQHKDILAARHVTLSPFLRIRASLRPRFVFFTN